MLVTSAFFLLSCGESSRGSSLGADQPSSASNPPTKAVGLGTGGVAPGGGGDYDGLGGNRNSPNHADGCLVYEIGDLQEGTMPLLGPVVRTFTSLDGQGNVVHVNEIQYQNPFTNYYQVVEDRTIIATSNDISQSIAPPDPDEQPETALWVDPETGAQFRIVKNEVTVCFVSSVDAEWLAHFFASCDFSVSFSWYEPPEEGGPGNEIAIFMLHFGPSYSGIEKVLSFLATVPEVEVAQPVFLNRISMHYPPPDDPLYTATPHSRNKHLDLLPSVGNPCIKQVWGNGRFYGYTPSWVIVVDSGVYRNHADFYYPNGSSPIHMIGADCYGFGPNRKPIYYVGWGYGSAKGTGNEPWRVHGTQVAGTITAATNNHKVAAAATPEIMVIPYWIAHDPLDPFKLRTDALTVAFSSANKEFQRRFWYFHPRVVNCSYGGPYPSVDEWIALGVDAYENNRLYVASSGNTYEVQTTFRAALSSAADFVLGVSGLWVKWEGDAYLSVIQGKGSTYHINPTVYPVSGIWGVYRVNNGIPTANYPLYVPSHPPDLAMSFDESTSFCCPQVSGLAAILFARHWYDWSYRDVKRRIVNTRGPDVGYHRGVVNYYDALKDW